jgi:plastocyanin
MIKYLFSIAFAFSSFMINAATHTITFGGAAGFNYQPSSLQAVIGDVIVFQGNFGSHPLSSVSVPSGADSFTQTSGSADFSYTVSVEGEYNYQCNFHFSSGMIGSFTVVHPLNLVAQPLTVLNTGIYPNPASETISFNVNTFNESCTAQIFSVTGQLVKTQNLSIDKSQKIAIEELADGVYFLKIYAADELLQTSKFIKN